MPRIYTTNWFRKGEDGQFVWPGYGENMRVLKWMIDRIEGSAKGRDNLFGITPAYDELNWTGLDFSPSKFDAVTDIDRSAWRDELKLHTELFDRLQHHLPKALERTRAKLEERLTA